jgi:hypothetical protein
MKFGRLPRKHDERIPKYSALTAKRAIAPPPTAVDYTRVLGNSLGEFGNDRLGDCTCAACYHALQVWSANANPPIDTEPDFDAVMLYEKTCGYVPGNPSTDQGGVEQDVLTYWLNTGIPTGMTGEPTQKLAAFVEVDQSNLEDIKRAIYEAGLVYIGFEIPQFFNTSCPVWDLEPGADNTIVDGHAVVLAGYNDALKRFKLISWGRQYEMTYRFFERFCDEAYLLVNEKWIESTGMTPAGLTLDELIAQMDALKWGRGRDPDHYRWHRRYRRIRRAKRRARQQEAVA